MIDELWPVFFPIANLIITVFHQLVLAHLHNALDPSLHGLYRYDPVAVVYETMKVHVHIEQQGIGVNIGLHQSSQAGEFG